MTQYRWIDDPVRQRANAPQQHNNEQHQQASKVNKTRMFLQRYQ